MKLFYFLLLGIVGLIKISFGQSGDNDKILLDTIEYQNVISFNNEELFEVTSDFADYALTYVDKDNMMAHLQMNIKGIFSDNFFSEEEQKQIVVNLNSYFELKYEEGNIIKIGRPEISDFMKRRRALENNELAIYFILRNYFGEAVEKGELKIKLNETNEFLSYLAVKYSSNKKRDKWEYIIDEQNLKYYSRSIYK